jgi:hypothetical protein
MPAYSPYLQLQSPEPITYRLQRGQTSGFATPSFLIAIRFLICRLTTPGIKALPIIAIATMTSKNKSTDFIIIYKP